MTAAASMNINNTLLLAVTPMQSLLVCSAVELVVLLVAGGSAPRALTLKSVLTGGALGWFAAGAGLADPCSWHSSAGC